MKSRKTYSLVFGVVVIVIIILWYKRGGEKNETSTNETETTKKGVELQNKVKLTVIYETLCPDSMAFVKGQLWPVYEKLGSNLDLDLVPWGKASDKRNGDTWTFECQHGPDECYGNKIHACVLEANDIDTSMKFVKCSMSARDPVSASENCAKSEGLDWQKISACANGDLGSSLLHNHGVRTKKLEPRLIFVPWIIFNDHFSESAFDKALENLLGATCDNFQEPKPQPCSGQ